MNQNIDEVKSHSIDIQEVFELFKTSKTGLDSIEAQKRLEHYGLNSLPEVSQKSAWIRFLLQFHNVLIYVLLAASFITAYLGDWLDTLVIWAVVFINAIIGFVQEGKAEAALDGLRKLLSLHAIVLRDGKKVSIKAEELVPGDVVYLKAGDKVPADLRLMEVQSLKAEESPLTGESLSVEKNTKTVAVDTDLADRKCLAFSGTVITYGTAKGIVVATGASTEIGRINLMLNEVQRLTTPLLKQIDDFGKVLSLVIVGLAGLFFALGYYLHNYELDELFLAVIGLSVAAIPEGLPALMTITLALGVQKMARKNAIIRSLPSVETLGSITVICSDKTGTLTKNEMTATSLQTASNNYQVSGTGYAPVGELQIAKERIELSEHSDLQRLIEIFALCNDAQIFEKENRWQVNGDPTEGALITLAYKAQFNWIETERLDVLPFDSKHKYMAILIEGENNNFVFIKGAPEKILDLAYYQLNNQNQHELNSEYWHKQIEASAAKGERVMAAAYLELPKSETKIPDLQTSKSIVFTGIVGMIDPPRDEVIQAINDCYTAGIQVKMITGDHALTASAIGEKLGINNGSIAITGSELERLDDKDWIAVANKYNIFARTTPEHKLRLVKALQESGEVIAMTGDGINDAPALKRANVGIAMGIKGSEVTKDAAEMVLADDNFTSISNAIRQGRITYDNLKKAILFILPTNGAEALVIMTALLMGGSLPITPAQILWINMVTAVTLGLALAFEPGEPKVMLKKPRKPNSAILDSYLLWRIVFVSVLIGGATLLMYKILMHSGVVINYARTVAVNTLAMGEAFYLLNCRNIHSTIFHKGFFSNPNIFYAIGTLIVLQLLFTYNGFFNAIFGTTAIDFTHWLWLLGSTFVVFILVELEKVVYNKIFK